MEERRPKGHIVFLLLCYLFSVGLIVIEAQHMGFDSDRAGHLLQVQDIARGNIFLSGWNLTKAHFLTTDLIPYLIGYLTGGGLGYRAAVIAYSVMYAALLAVTMTACLNKEVRHDTDQLDKVLFLALILYLCIPCWYLMGVGRIHVIAYVYCIIAMIIAAAYLTCIRKPMGNDAVDTVCEAVDPVDPKGDAGKRLTVLTILLTIGSFGDFLVFLYGALPVAIYAVVKIFLIRRGEKIKAFGKPLFSMESVESALKSTNGKKQGLSPANTCDGKQNLISDTVKLREVHEYRKLACAVLAAFPLSFVLDLLYYKIGGANKNGSIFSIHSSDPRVWGERFQSLMNAILKFAEGGLTGREFFSFDMFVHLCNALIVIISLLLMIAVLLHFFNGSETDPISVLLSISSLIAAAVYVFTERAEERYLELISVGLLIIFIRNLPVYLGRLRSPAVPKIFCIVLTYFALAGRVNEIVKEVEINAGREQQMTADAGALSRLLDENGCQNGYASFWNASVITALTKEKLCVRHIQRIYTGPDGCTLGMQMYQWFNKDEWYEEPANFVLIDNHLYDQGVSDSFGISEENCIAVFGAPVQRMEEGEYIVLIYDRDLSGILSR